jgi:hypothetical protein
MHLLPIRLASPRYCWTVQTGALAAGVRCLSGDCAGWCAVAGDCGGLIVAGRDADRYEQFSAGSGCSGRGRSRPIGRPSLRQRAVWCCATDVCRRQRDGRGVPGNVTRVLLIAPASWVPGPPAG